jgi:hypothetical protein
MSGACPSFPAFSSPATGISFPGPRPRVGYNKKPGTPLDGVRAVKSRCVNMSYCVSPKYQANGLAMQGLFARLDYPS